MDERGPYELSDIIGRLASLIWEALLVLWGWSFGQIVTMFQLPFDDLPVWKQVLFIVVIVSLVYLAHKVARDLLRAVQTMLGAVVGLIGAFIIMLPQIVWAGLIAFGGAWVIMNVNPSWVPSGMH
jgi:hypothetical protein